MWKSHDGPGMWKSQQDFCSSTMTDQDVEITAGFLFFMCGGHSPSYRVKVQRRGTTQFLARQTHHTTWELRDRRQDHHFREGVHHKDDTKKTPPKISEDGRRPLPSHVNFDNIVSLGGTEVQEEKKNKEKFPHCRKEGNP